MLSPTEIVHDRMYAKDAFSQWLGIKILQVDKGYAKIEMTIREEMLNGFHISHGGISFSFADSALAFACNSHGKQTVSIETSINHLKKVMLGDTLIAETEEEFYNGKIGKYRIKVTNQDQHLVASFNGLVYVSQRDWE